MLALIGLAGWLLQFDWIVSSCLSTGLDCDFFVLCFLLSFSMVCRNGYLAAFCSVYIITCGDLLRWAWFDWRSSYQYVDIVDSYLCLRLTVWCWLAKNWLDEDDGWLVSSWFVVWPLVTLLDFSLFCKSRKAVLTVKLCSSIFQLLLVSCVFILEC